MKKQTRNMVIFAVFILAIILIINMPKYEYQSRMCYQENVNTPFSQDAQNCTLTYNGNYNVNDCVSVLTNYQNFYDNNINTYASTSNAGNCLFYINYSKPKYKVNSALWQTFTTMSFTNSTIPLGCLNNNKLMLRIYIVAGAETILNYQCFDGHDWVRVFSEQDIGQRGLREESVIWEVSEKKKVS